MGFAAPRVWEKFYSRISFIMNDATAFGRFAYTRALKVAERRADLLAAGKQVSLGLGLVHRVLDFLVLRNIRVELGLARAHTIVSGAAPISAFRCKRPMARPKLASSPPPCPASRRSARSGGP